jgi:hydrazine synthase alpha subunit-like protein
MSRTSALALSLLALGASLSARQDPPFQSANPILFVTQVPVVSDYLTVASTFGNHRPTPHSVPRGGDLWLRYPNGDLRNLTAEAGFGERGEFQGENAIAVREPCVHWSGTKAVFSMLVGAPDGPHESDEVWQLYEVTGFDRGETAVITRVRRQPQLRNNVAPCYASDDSILFASDRPRGGQHLHPQLDEYEEAPTVTGLWSLGATGKPRLLNHAPSGAFKPIVDSYGRVVFTRWDHLERDQQADLDRMGLGNYLVYNWSGEGVGDVRTSSSHEVFPEPRSQWIDFVNSTPSYTGPLAGWLPHLAGNDFNLFLPWTIHQDGTGEETLGHIGRHELSRSVPRNRRDDFNVVPQSNFLPWVANANPLGAMHQLREDPRRPGSYLGIDCREFDTHASGQIVRIEAQPELNANEMFVRYVTHRDTQSPTQTPGPDHSGFYRGPLPLEHGLIVASHTANTLKDANIGTPSSPRSRFDFRLKALVPAGNGHLEPGPPLTGGLARRVQYFDPFQLLTHDGPLWELDAVEVVARPVPPPTHAADLALPEQRALTAEGVTESELSSWLVSNGLGLIVVRNATRRDRNDLQQPYNLQVPGGIETLGAPGTVYDVAWLRVFQGDLIRGITNGVTGTSNGRRVLAQPLHEPNAINPPVPGALPGSVALAPDGSAAALVPARRALSWQLTAPSGASVVNERYWVTLQPGEIRSCTGCHGANELDQADQPPPTNTPMALRRLLQHLKAQGEL